MAPTINGHIARVDCGPPHGRGDWKRVRRRRKNRARRSAKEPHDSYVHVTISDRAAHIGCENFCCRISS